MKKVKMNKIMIFLIISIMISGLGFTKIREKDTVRAETIKINDSVKSDYIDKEHKNEIRYVVEYMSLKNIPKRSSTDGQKLEVGATVKILKEYAEWSYVELVLPWSEEAINKGWIETRELYTYDEMRKYREKSGGSKAAKGITVLIKKGAKELSFSGEVIGEFKYDEYGRVFDMKNSGMKKVYDLELGNGQIVQIGEEYIEFLK